MHVDDSVWLVENRTPYLYVKPKFYVGDPWYPALDGNIRNVKIKSSLCPPDWIAVDGGCYYAEESQMTFTEAQHFCTETGGSLILASGEKEQQGLTKKFADLTSKKLRFWIDAKMVAGTLKTGNGEKELTTAAPWDNTADSRTGDCVRTGPDFKWFKAGCDSKGEPGGYTWNPMCKLCNTCVPPCRNCLIII